MSSSQKLDQYWVVDRGRHIGIFNDEPSLRAATYNYPGARKRAYDSLEEAEKAFGTEGHRTLLDSEGRLRPDALLGKKARAKKERRAAKKKKQAAKRNEQKRQNGRTTPSLTLKELSNNRNQRARLIQIYCDGSCGAKSYGPAASGLATFERGVLTDIRCGDFTPNGSANRAELTALLRALERAAESLKQDTIDNALILSDSRYAINCVTDWAKKWQRNGWRVANGQPVKNRDLIEQCVKIYESIEANVKVRHVKGHTGVPGNEIADLMCNYARENRISSHRSIEDSDLQLLLTLQHPAKQHLDGYDPGGSP